MNVMHSCASGSVYLMNMSRVGLADLVRVPAKNVECLQEYP